MSLVIEQSKQKRRQQQVKKFAQEVLATNSNSLIEKKCSIVDVEILSKLDSYSNNNNNSDSKSHHQASKFTPEIRSVSISPTNNSYHSTVLKPVDANNIASNHLSAAEEINNNNNHISDKNTIADAKLISSLPLTSNYQNLDSELIGNRKIENMESTKRNKLSQAVENKLTNSNTTASNGTTATPVSDNNSPPIEEQSPDLINEKLSSGLRNNNILDNQSSTNSTIPPYSSIFNTSYYRAITQQQQSKNGSNNNQQLKKQQATDLYSEPSIRSSGGRLPTVLADNQRNNHNQNKHLSNGYNDYKDEHNLQASDMDDNDIDEHLPLSSSMTKIRNGLSNSKRVSPTESGSSPIIGKRSLQITNFDNYHQPSTQRCNNKSPHTKISMSVSDHQRQQHNQTNQPTSFSHHHSNNNCHHNHFGSSNRKLDWQESASCIDCDCNNCYLKFKSAMSHDAGCCRGFTTSSKTKGSSKTKSMHMILKSIILVLLTLLLLILFIGMIAASHFLPEAFDKLLTATRSFNVTIQG